MGLSFRYCPYCRKVLQPFSDGERLRLICPGCGWVYYRNPTVGVAVILLQPPPITGSVPHLLLGERRSGGWCIPCGHVEWDEDIEAAAQREFREETGLEVRLDRVFAVHSNFHNPQHHTVGVWYRGHRVSGVLRPGGDLLQVGYFPLDELPELVFPTDRLVCSQLLDSFTPPPPEASALPDL
jgi:8-oxo-dGTP diphosphatase